MDRSSLKASLRRLPRQPTDTPVIVHCHGRVQSARVKDFTRDGLRVSGTFGLFEQDHIHLQLATQKLAGIVVWALGSDVGIALKEQLNDISVALMTHNGTGHGRKVTRAQAGDTRQMTRPAATP